MEKRILIDLNDKANWLYESTSPPTKGGHIVEHNRVIMLPEGEHKLFAFTDAVMHYAPDIEGGEHEHRNGYETFFIDSGSMDFYSLGQYCTLKKGDLVHIQPYVTHGMVFHEDTRYRGIFQDWAIIDNFPETYALKERAPEAVSKMPPPDFANMDLLIREKFNCVKVPPEQINAVRNPARPLAQFDFDGVTMKMMVGRWELGGVREIWRAELQKGVSIEWADVPTIPDLFYVTEGTVRFKVYNEEYVAYEDCLVKIPKFAPRSLVAETDAAMYDLGGLTCWYEMLHDYVGMRQNNPDKLGDADAMDKLFKSTNCFVRSIKK